MSTIENRDPEDRFVAAWRQWVGRPPGQSPAEAAAAISRRLRSRKQRHYWWPLAAAAAATAAVVLAINWPGIIRRESPPAPAINLQESAPMSNGEVLIWLDEQTPLYMTFQPPGNEPASENKL